MIFRNTLEAALYNLHEIEDLLKVFPADGNIPAIEIDLTLQKIRNLYELLLMMKSGELKKFGRMLKRRSEKLMKKLSGNRKSAYVKNLHCYEHLHLQEL